MKKPVALINVEMKALLTELEDVAVGSYTRTPDVTIEVDNDGASVFWCAYVSFRFTYGNIRVCGTGHTAKEAVSQAKEIAGKIRF